VVRGGVGEGGGGRRAPASGRGAAQRRRVAGGAGQCAPERDVEGEFRDEEVRRDAGQVEHQRLDAEAALPRLREFVLDDVEVAVVDVDPAALDGQPGTAVEDAAAPPADLGDLALPADGPQVVRVEGAPVVDRQVPVAVGPLGALGARTAQGDGPDAGEGGEPVGGPVPGLPVQELLVPGLRVRAGGRWHAGGLLTVGGRGRGEGAAGSVVSAVRDARGQWCRRAYASVAATRAASPAGPASWPASSTTTRSLSGQAWWSRHTMPRRLPKSRLPWTRVPGMPLRRCASRRTTPSSGASPRKWSLPQ